MFKNKQKQLGWNCFDIAVNVERADWVKYALMHCDDLRFRQLLAPEIKQALTITAVYMNTGNEEILPACLPKTMHTEKVKLLVNKYFEAENNIQSDFIACNEALGYREGDRINLEQMIIYFLDENNQQLHQEVYEQFSAAKQKFLTPVLADIEQYCLEPETYEMYINDYYGQENWVAFQRDFQGQRCTSCIIDIIALFLNRDIWVNDANEKTIYKTNANNLHNPIIIYYNGHNHFYNKFGLKRDQTLQSNNSGNFDVTSFRINKNKWLHFKAFKNKNNITLQSGKKLKVIINVPCTRRAVYYQPLLQNVYTHLLDFLTPLNSQFITLLPSLLEKFSSVLDDQIIECLNKDFKDYRDEKNLDLNQLSKKDALHHYKIYFKIHHNLITHLNDKYEFFPNLMQQLTNNYLRAMTKALQRINRDWQLLIENFAQELGSDIYLSNITSGDSDFHKQGEQVLMLTFSNLQGQEKRVIYKPSPVMADTLLFGDIKRLKNINEHYKSAFEDHFSLLELLNTGLINPFITYLVVPCQDEVKETLEEQKSEENFAQESIDLASYYGYIEFLPHQPWKSPDYKAVIKQVLIQKELYQRQIEGSNDAQLVINNYFADFLQQAASDPHNDYITKNDIEIEQYSYDCGLLLALMTITQMNDGHCQNFIITKRRILPIDGEICFSQRMHSIADTACFDKDFGGMNQHSTIKEYYTTLFDISGKNEIEIKHLEKNRLFHLFKFEDQQIKACGIMPEILIKGFKEGFQILSINKEKLVAWFNLKHINQIIIRVPLISTGVFADDIREHYKYNFSEFIYKQYRQRKIIKFIDNYFSENEISKCPEELIYNKDKLFVFFPQPIFAVFRSEQHLLEEFISLNIPIYYAVAHEKKLYNSFGKIVLVPKLEVNNKKISLDEFDEITEIDTSYFKISPLDSTRNYALQLIDQPDLTELLITQLSNFIEIYKMTHGNYDSPNDDASQLLEINVELDSDPEEKSKDEQNCYKCKLS